MLLTEKKNSTNIYSIATTAKYNSTNVMAFPLSVDSGDKLAPGANLTIKFNRFSADNSDDTDVVLSPASSLTGGGYLFLHHDNTDSNAIIPNTSPAWIPLGPSSHIPGGGGKVVAKKNLTTIIAIISVLVILAIIAVIIGICAFLLLKNKENIKLVYNRFSATSDKSFGERIKYSFGKTESLDLDTFPPYDEVDAAVKSKSDNEDEDHELGEDEDEDNEKVSFFSKLSTKVSKFINKNKEDDEDEDDEEYDEENVDETDKNKTLKVKKRQRRQWKSRWYWRRCQ